MITDDLTKLIHDAVSAAHTAGEFPLETTEFAVKLESPNNKVHGDFSTNVALTLKKATGLSDSREIAAKLVRHLPASDFVERVEIAGPGFINFYLKPTWLHNLMLHIEQEQTCYGTTNARHGERILIEFVSANPTGPISVVNGRAAALGDVLANLFAAQGCEVGREFYINDALNSTQLDRFAQSVGIRYLQLLGHAVQFPPDKESGIGNLEPGFPETDAAKPVLQFPEEGYLGEYVRDIARAVLDEDGDVHAAKPDAERNAFFRSATLEKMIAAQRNALDAFGLKFDTWFYESSLYADSKVERTIAALKERGYAYEQDGALWLKSTEFGDDKDRVLIRSNEKATYIAADTAYHDDKFQRGWTHLINIWGADHHGYVARLKAGVAALGHDPKHLEIILTQLVSIVRDGEVVLGGKRKGNVIELKEDLIDDIGRDAARFYFLLNAYETPATVDVELAKRQSYDNPVYYVQYAHARVCSVIRRAEEAGLTLKPASECDLSLIIHPAEIEVLRKLSEYPAEIALAAKDYAPHRLPRWAMEIAGLLNVFYENCRVLSGKDEVVPAELTQARLALVNGARIVLRNLLGILGISAPEKM